MYSRLSEYLYVPGSVVKIGANVIYLFQVQCGVLVNGNLVRSNCVMRLLINLMQLDALLIEGALCAGLGRYSSALLFC